MRSMLLKLNSMNINYYLRNLKMSQKITGNITRTIVTQNNVLSSISQSNKEVTCDEVKIDMPWGYLAGKWWGPKTVRPIVCLHGWQDNAGTFDTLIPLLPKHLSYLSIDLPGHGLSSRIPDGMFYSTLDTLHIINLIIKKYEWSKISLMSHSMSSIINFLYASTFTDRCDFIIGIDALKPHVRDPKRVIDIIGTRIDKFFIADQQNRSQSEPPAYTYDEIIDKWCQATRMSITKETAKYLMNRAIKPSKIYTNKYYFSRDSRLKCFNYLSVSQELCLEMAKRITVPYLFIKAKHSPYYENKEYFDETIKILQETNKNFEFHIVDGTHHLHLTHPHSISGIIEDFLFRQNASSVIDPNLMSSVNSKL